jgi:hypothetical protein
MRVTIEMDLRVTMGGVAAAGVNPQGTLPAGTRYVDISKVFGIPRFEESGNQVKCEWAGEINGLVFTIYGYKSRHSVEGNNEWQIGGDVALVAELVNCYFSNSVA